MPGVSFWRGERDINAASVGVEIVNPGHEYGYRAFPDRQIHSLLALLADIRSRWTIPDERILGHSDVAPARKIDPGELFPWRRLALEGHGLWVEPPAAPGAPLTLGDEGLGVMALQGALARLGYEASPERGVRRGHRDAACAPSSGIGCRPDATASPTATRARG